NNKSGIIFAFVAMIIILMALAGNGGDYAKVAAQTGPLSSSGVCPPIISSINGSLNIDQIDISGQASDCDGNTNAAVVILSDNFHNQLASLAVTLSPIPPPGMF